MAETLQASARQYSTLVGEGWQQFVPYVPGKSIESLASEAGFSPREICKLASNENPLPVSPLVREALVESLSDLARYPDGDGEPLKSSLAAYLGVSAAQVALGTGSNSLLDGLARLFVQKGDKALYSAHAFIVYKLAVQAVDGVGIEVPTKAWGHDIDGFIAEYRQLQQKGCPPKIIFLANPNNPTGTWFDEAALVSLLETVDQTKTLVVLDEAYAEYVQLSGYPNGLKLLPQYPNLIVTRTFSKAYGLAALRVGYAVAQPDLITWLNMERAPFNVSGPGLVAAKAALEDQAFLKKSITHNNEALLDLVQWCDAKGFDYIPSVANFVTIATQKPGVEVYQALLKKGVIARPVANYGLPNHLRVSVGTESENERFKAAFLTSLS